MKISEILTEDIEVKDTVEDSFRGGYDGTIYATDNGAHVGYIQYSMYQNKPAIKMIWVSPEYRRQKISYKMLKALQELSPEEEIDWGYTTDDGTNLKKSINFIKKPNKEVIAKKSKLAGVRSKLAQLKHKLEELQKTDPEKARAFMASVGDRWNKFNDMEYRLENELYDNPSDYTRLIPESDNTVSFEIKWNKLKSMDDQQEDSLNRTSKWSQNTFGGAENLLYGEAFSGTKLIGRIMLGIHEDLGMLEIDKVWVDKNSRRHGIASQMINQAKKLTGINELWAPHTTDDGDYLMKSI
jgi:GNAT superfamily N-acetyltransferase